MRKLFRWAPGTVFDHEPSAEEWVGVARLRAAKLFWPKVDKDGPNGCWLWMASKDKGGYGETSITALVCGETVQTHVRAHRLSYEMVHGPLQSTSSVLHSCDTPACVNPAHLRPGTPAENYAVLAAFFLGEPIAAPLPYDIAERLEAVPLTPPERLREDRVFAMAKAVRAGEASAADLRSMAVALRAGRAAMVATGWTRTLAGYP